LQSLQLRLQPRPVQLGVRHHYSRSLLLQSQRILHLVVSRSIRIRHQYRRDATRQKLGHRASGPRNGHIGSSEGKRKIIEVRVGLVPLRSRQHGGGNSIVIGLSRHMQDLKVGNGASEGLNDRVVESPSAQTPAEDEHCQKLLAKPEARNTLLARGLKKTRP